MKKPKVAIMTYSKRKTDGSRDFINAKPICTCIDNNTAYIIQKLMRDAHLYEHNFNGGRYSDGNDIQMFVGVIDG